MSEIIKNRYEFTILFDVENGNPNGDPDAANMPRIDPETGLGLVTDVCLKRKIRNYVEDTMEDAPGYGIYIKDGVPLNTSDKRAYTAVLGEGKKLEKKDPEIDLKLRDFMCANFYDVRTFGAVMTTFVKDKLNCGQVRGPVQIGFARSVDPIVRQEVTITRVAITTEADYEKKTPKWDASTSFHTLFTVPTALFRQISRAASRTSPRMTSSSCGMPSSICLKTTTRRQEAKWLCASSSYSSMIPSSATLLRTARSILYR